jgi:hypothetical protein
VALIWVVSIGTLLLIPVLFLAGLRNERALVREWALVLTPRGQKALRRIEERLEGELTLVEVPYERAAALHHLGSIEEARRFLGFGYDSLARFSPDMTHLLASMAVFSRMVAALAPVAPVAPSRFQLRYVVSVARAGRVLHHFLVTAGERFRLRLFILGHGFRIATRFALQSTTRISAAPHLEEEWALLDAARGDFRTLTDESLLSFRTLLTSLNAAPR